MKDITEKVKKLFETYPQYNELWVNEKGEFFTNENLCINSKQGDCKLIERDKSIEDVIEGVQEDFIKKIQELLEKGEDIKSYLERLTVDNLKKIANEYPDIKLGSNYRKEEIIECLIKKIK